MSKKIEKQSPERLYITNINDCSDINHQKHIYRYKFSSLFINGGFVLDCACGSGYGSKILSEKADKILGIDVSKKSINFANKNNKSKNIVFECRSLQSLKFKDNSLQTIVSLETLEHIDKKDMINFLKKSKKWLVPGGQFIGSSPMLRYQEGLPFITNPYHINELPKKELLSAISTCFSKFKIYFFHQNVDSFNILDEENTGFCIFIARKPYA